MKRCEHVDVFTSDESCIMTDIDIVVAWGIRADQAERLNSVKWIQSTGAGVDRIIIHQWPAGAIVTRVRESASIRDNVAAYVYIHMMSFCNPHHHYLEAARRGAWEPKARRRPEDSQVCVVGIGMVGKAIAHELMSLGFSVVGVSRSGATVDSFSVSGVDHLLERVSSADAVVLAVPLTQETRGMYDRTVLQAMANDSVLINVSRGRVIVEEDLLNALEQPHGISQAILDVFDHEPLPGGHVYWTHSCVRVTPHVAGMAEPGEAIKEFCENLERFLAGQPLLNAIDHERGY